VIQALRRRGSPVSRSPTKGPLPWPVDTNPMEELRPERAGSAACTNEQAVPRALGAPRPGGAGERSDIRAAGPTARAVGRVRSPGRLERRIHAPLDLAAALYYMSHCSPEGSDRAKRCAPYFPTESSPLPSPKDTMLVEFAHPRGAGVRGAVASSRAEGAPLLEGARALRGRMLRGADVEAREHIAATARMRRSGSSRYNPHDHRAAREGEDDRATRLGGPS